MPTRIAKQVGIGVYKPINGVASACVDAEHGVYSDGCTYPAINTWTDHASANRT